MPKGNTKENGTNNLKIKRFIQRLFGSFHDFLLRAPGRTRSSPLFLGSTFGGRMFPGVRSRGGQRILSVSRRGRDRAKGGSVLCTIAGWRHVRKGRQSIIAGGGRGNTTRPRQEGRRGRGTTAGSPADRSGGSIEGAVLWSGVVRRGVVVLWGKFVPADVRDAHLRLDQQGLIDVLNDRFVLRRSVAECAFLRLVGIGARAPAPAASNVKRMNRCRGWKRRLFMVFPRD